MGSAWTKLIPPAAHLTEKNLPDQTGKVFIVTGSSSGVGRELAQILYSHNAKVYVAARSASKAAAAIQSIKTNFPNAKGELIFLDLDLSDLETIKQSANEFLTKESRLDVLFNNAGVMCPPQGSKTKQGYELQIGTNNLAPYLFSKLLTPLLLKTAKTAPAGSVRIVWVSSAAAEMMSPQGGVNMQNLDYKVDQSMWYKYGVSKAGNYYHATTFAKKYGSEGLISVACDPGNLKTDLQRNMSKLHLLLIGWSQYHPIYGSYTEMFSGLSPEVTLERNGAWIAPWGRFVDIRKDLAAGHKTRAEGGTGIADAFAEWTEEQIRPYQ
ncbi:short-chain dehydrogenase [Emericellopsis atlantica]|uniref:Short-chain dehydrogenase n=1 Tax=Emericellopsis atlantica TaxID=2614577 RepID=A0A9P7ZID5_9HYPO|nr:short-chain dehydrogenase [Emericellopsis atlantica]KAG9252683.1 short-chain dehydrogenase [Emericellopsis atlantica]